MEKSSETLGPFKGVIGMCGVYGHFPNNGNQMEKKIETEIETGLCRRS